jgi:hypothetical protein
MLDLTPCTERRRLLRILIRRIWLIASHNQRRVALRGSLFHRQPGFHPPLLSFWIVRYVRVTHRRQFTGGVFAGVSMRVRAVGNDLNILVGQQLRGEFFDLFRGDVQGSGNMGFAVPFRREGLDHLNRVFPV